jgi:hypothetical protein
MIGQSLGCTFPLDDVLVFAQKRGIYIENEKSFFHALDRVFAWMKLNSESIHVADDAALAKIVQSIGVVLLETNGHVIVIDGARTSGTGYSFDVRDPALTKSETNVSHNDPRLKDRTGRVWMVWR